MPTPPLPALPPLTGLILAGGRGTRLGGVNKGLIELHGRPLIEYVLDRLRPQTGAILINANRHHERYAAYGVPVIPDLEGGFAGPLAGIAAGLATARTDWVVVVPCDCPLLPSDLVARLWQARCTAEADVAVAQAAGRLQPVFALVPVTARAELERRLRAGERKVETWLKAQRLAIADFSDEAEAFVNVNTEEERRAVEERLVSFPRPLL